MADDNSMVKTDESNKDVHSLIPGDTPAQAGASMGVSL